MRPTNRHPIRPHVKYKQQTGATQPSHIRGERKSNRLRERDRTQITGRDERGRQEGKRRIGGLTTRDSCRTKSGGRARLPAAGSERRRRLRGRNELMDLGGWGGGGEEETRGGGRGRWWLEMQTWEIFEGPNDKYSREGGGERKRRVRVPRRPSAARLLRCDVARDVMARQRRNVTGRHEFFFFFASGTECGRATKSSGARAVRHDWHKTLARRSNG